MFKCYCQCYNNFFNPSPENQGVYIDILNETHVAIFFIVQYTIDVRTFTKQTPIFNYNQSQRIPFQQSAMNICFNVIDNSYNPPECIFNVALPKCKRHCYILTKPGSEFNLTEISC